MASAGLLKMAGVNGEQGSHNPWGVGSSPNRPTRAAYLCICAGQEAVAPLRPSLGDLAGPETRRAADPRRSRRGGGGAGSAPDRLPATDRHSQRVRPVSGVQAVHRFSALLGERRESDEPALWVAAEDPGGDLAACG